VPGLLPLLRGPGWGGALFRGLTRPGVIRYFLERTWGPKAIDEDLWRDDVLTTRQPGAEHAPLHVLSGGLFSADIHDVYERLTQPVWMSHGVLSDRRRGWWPTSAVPGVALIWTGAAGRMTDAPFEPHPTRTKRTTMPLNRPLSALTLALAAALAPALPGTALAQNTQVISQTAPGVTGFGVTPIEQLRPGEVLQFKLEGTPGARVRVDIAGAVAPLTLSEVAPGRYEGEYTIRLRDKLQPSGTTTARLEKDGQAVTATLAQSLQAGAGPVANSPISSFHVSAPAQVQPGDELILALHGLPGGQASASVQGIAQRIDLPEVKPGVYEGAYVVRRKDKVRSPMVADGKLVVNKRASTLRFAAAEHGGAGSSQPVVSCGHCGSVTAVNIVKVKSDQPNVIGTIAGGVLGGVLGHQVGGGSGRDLATIAGAVGGAYAGNRVENNMNKKQVHRVSVKLDNGTTRTFDYAEDPGLKPGARVKVVNNALERA